MEFWPLRSVNKAASLKRSESAKRFKSDIVSLAVPLRPCLFITGLFSDWSETVTQHTLWYRCCQYNEWIYFYYFYVCFVVCFDAFCFAFCVLISCSTTKTNANSQTIRENENERIERLKSQIITQIVLFLLARFWSSDCLCLLSCLNFFLVTLPHSQILLWWIQFDYDR